MAQKENQRIALTRRLLQEGLLRLLRHNELESISVTALCKEAGINRATFYNHYTSPASLLEEMETQLVAELKVISTASSVDEVIIKLEQYCIKLRENAELVEILVRYHTDKDLEDIVISLTEYYSTYRLDLNQTKLDPETTHLVSTFLYSGSYSLVREWLIRGIDKSPREIAELMISIISKDYL